MPAPLPYEERFQDNPELLDLILDTNERISRLVRYGPREMVLASRPAWRIRWSNASEDWSHGPIRRWDPSSRSSAIVKAGEPYTLDANELVVYAPERSVKTILPYLNWLPLYGYSTEAREGGIGEAPPPWTMHWTWTDPEGGPPLSFRRRPPPGPPPGLPPLPHELLGELLRKMGLKANPFEVRNGPTIMPSRSDESSEAMKAYAKKVLEESRRRRKERQARGETRSWKKDIHTGEEFFWDREKGEWVKE